MRFKFLALFVFLFFAGCELLVSLNESSADSLELEVIKDDLESLNENESRIFFTKDLKGFIDICGCSEDMAGGLPRIASLKSKYQNSILKNTEQNIWTSRAVFNCGYRVVG